MKKLQPRKLEKLATVLKAAAHPLRLGIIDLIDKRGELAVNEICAELDSDQSLTSHHLKNMKLNGILSCRREGQQIFYRLQLEEITGILRCLETCKKL